MENHGHKYRAKNCFARKDVVLKSIGDQCIVRMNPADVGEAGIQGSVCATNCEYQIQRRTCPLGATIVEFKAAGGIPSTPQGQKTKRR